MNNKHKYTETEKKQILSDVEVIKNVANVAKKYDIPKSTIHTWLHNNKTKKNHNSKNANLITENKRLLKELRHKELENNILKELLKKTLQVLS